MNIRKKVKNSSHLCTFDSLVKVVDCETVVGLFLKIDRLEMGASRVSAITEFGLLIVRHRTFQYREIGNKRTSEIEFGAKNQGKNSKYAFY